MSICLLRRRRKLERFAKIYFQRGSSHKLLVGRRMMMGWVMAGGQIVNSFGTLIVCCCWQRAVIITTHEAADCGCPIICYCLCYATKVAHLHPRLVAVRRTD